MDTQAEKVIANAGLGNGAGMKARGYNRGGQQLSHRFRIIQIGFHKKALHGARNSIDQILLQTEKRLPLLHEKRRAFSAERTMCRRFAQGRDHGRDVTPSCFLHFLLWGLAQHISAPFLFLVRRGLISQSAGGGCGEDWWDGFQLEAFGFPFDRCALRAQDALDRGLECCLYRVLTPSCFVFQYLDFARRDGL